MVTRVSLAAAQAALAAMVALLNGGTIKIYSGAAPTNVEDTATGTLLATLPLSATAFGAPTDQNPNALATANAVTSALGAATGNAGYFRACKSDGVAIMQGSCGASAADMILSDVAITPTKTVAVSSWTIALPEVGN